MSPELLPSQGVRPSAEASSPEQTPRYVPQPTPSFGFEQIVESLEETSGYLEETNYDLVAQADPPPPDPDLRRAQNQMGVIEPPGDDEYPPSAWSRVTARYSAYRDMGSAPQAYANDLFVYHAETYPSIGNPGTTTVLWDFYSPNTDHNLTARGTSSSIQFEYTSVGDSASAFDAEYTLNLTVWDRRWPEGRLLNGQTEKNDTQLQELSLFAGVAARDVGTWTFKETRDGNESAPQTFEVLPTPEPDLAWNRRVTGAGYQDAVQASPIVFDADEWFVHKQTYNLAEIEAIQPPDPDPSDPAADMSNTSVVYWHWDSPFPEANTNKFGSYLSVRFRYHHNNANTVYVTSTKVYDAAYRNGRLIEYNRVEGTPPTERTLFYGQGLPGTGQWNFREVINGVESPPVAIDGRDIKLSFEQAREFNPDNGPQKYIVKVQPVPATWTPANFDVVVDIQDVDTGAIIRTLTQPVTGNTDNPATVELSWDGKDSGGAAVEQGRVIMPYPRIEVSSVVANEPRTVASNGALDVGMDLMAVDTPTSSCLIHDPVYQNHDEPYGADPNPPDPSPDPPAAPMPQTVSYANGASTNYVRLPGLSGVLVDANTGNYTHGETDLAIPTRGLPIVISRTYRSADSYLPPRYGWRWNFEQSLSFEGQDIVLNVPGRPPSRYQHRFIGDGGAVKLIYANYRGDENSRIVMADTFTYVVEHRDFSRSTFRRSTLDPRKAYLTRIEDRNGNALIYNWDESGDKLLSIVDPSAPNRVVNLTWGTKSFPTEIQDWAGRKIIYGFQTQGSATVLASVRKKAGYADQPDSDTITRYDYQNKSSAGKGAKGHFLGTVSREGVGIVSNLALTPFGRFLEATSHTGVRTTLAVTPGQTILSNTADQGIQSLTTNLGAQGRPASIIDPTGGLTRFEYDPNGNVSLLIDPRSKNWRFVHNAETNDLLSATDPYGNRTRFVWATLEGKEHDTLQRVIQPLGELTRYNYDPNGNLINVINPEGDKSIFVYNEYGQLARSKDAEGNVSKWNYDENGYLHTYVLPYSGDDDNDNGRPRWRFVKDSLGRTKKAIDPKQHTTSYTYDKLDRVLQIDLPQVAGESVPPVIRYAWNRHNQIETVTDTKGRLTRFVYDEVTRYLREVHEPGTVITRFQYDSHGNMTHRVQPGGGSTDYTYDLKDRLRSISYPGGTGMQLFDYDENDNVVTWTKGALPITYTYDDANRLTGIVAFPGTNPVSFGYDANNRPLSATNNLGTISWSYFPDSAVQSISGPGGSLSYTYDKANRVKTIEPEFGGPITTYTYTGRSQLASAKIGSVEVGYGYDDNGNLTSTSYSNGVTASMDYDERDRVTQMTYLRGTSEPLLTLDYTYDVVGNVATMHRETATSELTRRYTYDLRDQLTRVEQSLPGTGFAQLESFQYDDNMNRTQRDGVAASHNSADQLTSTAGQSMVYMLTGAISSITGGGANKSFSGYNYADLPQFYNDPSSQVSYTYDALNRRISRSVNGSSRGYLWAGSEVLRELAAGDEVFYLLGNGREAVLRNGGYSTYARDRLGSTVMLFDETGNVEAEWDYTAYGEPQALQLAPDTYNPFLFTGQQYDREEGQYYLRARYYNPTLGRFLVRDPIGYQGGMNLYAYCGNNPINCTDPSGLDELSWKQVHNEIVGRKEQIETYYYRSNRTAPTNHVDNKLSQVTPGYLLALVWWEAGGFNPSAVGTGVHGEPVYGLFQMNEETLAEVKATSTFPNGVSIEEFSQSWTMQIEAGLLLWDLYGVSRWDARSEAFAKMAGPAIDAQLKALGPANADPSSLLSKEFDAATYQSITRFYTSLSKVVQK
ncbi:MAG: RHS repeat domain-containing protein [Vulcanimicrobiota bacterium]